MKFPKEVETIGQYLRKRGYVIAPIEPTEEMIQAACLSQCTEKFATYEEWWNSHSSGVSARIRDLLVRDYRAMIAALEVPSDVR